MVPFCCCGSPICWKNELDDTVLCHFDPISGIFDPDKLPGAGELHTLVFMSFMCQFLLTVNDDVLVIFLIPMNYQVSFILSCLVFMSL